MKRRTQPVWLEIYAALIKCRKNILNVFPEEYATFPLNGELDRTRNHTGIQQSWSKTVMLYQVLNSNDELKSFEDLNLVNGPIKMEYEAIKVVVGKKVEYLKTFCKTNFDKLLLGIRPIISNFNVYGRIVFNISFVTYI